MKKLLFVVAAVTAVASFAASKTPNSISLNEKIQLQSRQEFAEDGAWVISCLPVYNNLVKASETTNSFGMINTSYTYDYVISSYVLNKQLLDTINGFTVASKPTYSVVPITSGIVATISGDVISANKEGSVTLIANDGDRIITKPLAFKNYSVGNQVTYYTGDTNTWVNALYNQWYAYVANRSATVKSINSGYNCCKGYVAANDFIWSDKDFRYYQGSSYNSDLYVPASNVAFRLLDNSNAIKYSGNAIGSRVSLNTAVYGEVTDAVSVDCDHTHKWMKADGSKGIRKAVKAYNLSNWAKTKGCYTELEIRAVNDTIAYVYSSDIPVECQAAIARATIYGDIENDAPNSTNCLALTRSPGFSISQHGTLVPQYFSGACAYNSSGAVVTTSCSNGDFRKDGIGIDKIEPYHSGHTSESGRPWFWIFNGQTILQGCYHFANDASSYTMGWRIIRDFCKQNGSTCNLYDMINGTKTVVSPTL